MQIINSALFVAAIAFAVYSAVSQSWWQLVYAVFLALGALSNRSLNKRALRHLRDAQAGDATP